MRKCEFCHFVNDLWSIRCCWILMDICSTFCLTVFIRWLLSVETNNKRNLSLLTPKLPATSFTAHRSEQGDTRQRASRKKQHSKSVNTSKIVNNMMQYIHFTNGMLQKKYRFDSKTTNTAGVFIWKKQNLNQWCLFIYFFNFFFFISTKHPMKLWKANLGDEKPDQFGVNLIQAFCQTETSLTVTTALKVPDEAGCQCGASSLRIHKALW